MSWYLLETLPSGSANAYELPKPASQSPIDRAMWLSMATKKARATGCKAIFHLIDDNELDGLRCQHHQQNVNALENIQKTNMVVALPNRGGTEQTFKASLNVPAAVRGIPAFVHEHPDEETAKKLTLNAALDYFLTDYQLGPCANDFPGAPLRFQMRRIPDELATYWRNPSVLLAEVDEEPALCA